MKSRSNFDALETTLTIDAYDRSDFRARRTEPGTGRTGNTQSPHGCLKNKCLQLIWRYHDQGHSHHHWMSHGKSARAFSVDRDHRHCPPQTIGLGFGSCLSLSTTTKTSLNPWTSGYGLKANNIYKPLFGWDIWSITSNVYKSKH